MIHLGRIDGRISPRRKFTWILAASVLILSTRFTSAEDAKPDVAPPAKWVAPISFQPDSALNPIDPSTEIRLILKDRQINADLDENFYHEVRQVLTPGGVMNGSHISVDYDPNYQLLTFHWVRIWRGKKALDRLDRQKIEVTERGLDEDELLFSAEKSAVLLLDDVRMGDIIDFAYSVQGKNPVLASNFSGFIHLQGSDPVDRLTTRLLWPVARHLYVKNHESAIQYGAVRKGSMIEFTWTARNMPGWKPEPPLPPSYQPLPWVQLSEFQKWSDVNKFALGLFTNKSPFSPELSRKIQEWKQLGTDEDRVVAALRFVQDEVRYLGIETGASGYTPAAPSVVFDRRYGDCKDKSFLLVTLLRALRIDASPVLVNTKLKQFVSELHPDATIFDHCITQVNLGGQTFYLDATANYERGSLAFRAWPLYGYGLVVRPGTAALTPITPSQTVPKTTVTQYIQLGRLDQASSIRVVTMAEGTDAEAMRQEFATTSRDDIQRRYLNYYSKLYSGIEVAAPLVFTDNEGQNQVEVDEFYRVPQMWEHQPDERYYHCRIYPENIETAMRPPAISLRTMPLAVNYPTQQTFRAEVSTPGITVNAPDEQTIENPAFYFHRSVSIAPGKVFMECEYRSLAQEIATDAVPTYINQLNTAGNFIDYTISSQ